MIYISDFCGASIKSPKTLNVLKHTWKQSVHFLFVIRYWKQCTTDADEKNFVNNEEKNGKFKIFTKAKVLFKKLLNFVPNCYHLHLNLFHGFTVYENFILKNTFF